MIFALKHALSSERLLRIAVVGMCLAAVTSVHAAERVRVTGSTRLPATQLRKVVAKELARADTAAALRRVHDAYIADGYLFTTIEVAVDPVDSTLHIHVMEGEPARFGYVRVSGVKHWSQDEARRRLRVGSGRLFVPRRLQNDIQQLLADYDRDGFPFAQVWIDSLQLDPAQSTVNMVVYVVEGGVKPLGRVKFSGLEKTREELAVRLSGLEAGRRYDGEKLREAYLRLSASGLFEDVAYPTVRLSPRGGSVEALIDVVEARKSNMFSSAFGYADREGEQDRVFSGVVQLDLVNIGGSLRDLHVFWRNDGAGRSETRLQFRQRFFFGRRITTGIRLEQIGLDTLYTWQSIGLETEAPVGRVLGGLLSVDVAAYGDRNTFSEGRISQSLRIRLAGGASLAWGKERRGTYVAFRNRHGYARKGLDGRDGSDAGSVSQYIVEAHLRVANDVTPSVHMSNELHFFDLESQEAFVPLSEQFNLGGAGTLRGYRENQFHSRRLAYSRSELRIGRSRNENAYLFVDGGYVLDEDQATDGVVTSEDVFKVGYGFGLRTQSKAGNIDISFGVGDQLSLRQTKVHVILNRTF